MRVAVAEKLDEVTPAERCRRYRLKILEMSQRVTAMHVAPAFSCIEIVDVIYNEVMKQGDTFLMSKGHGCVAQYVVLNDRGVLSDSDLADYCTPAGILGAHPDLGVPGIAASTGSLGHGLGMAVGMALADKEHTIYVLCSDGELQEGSTWEAILMASSLKLSNLVLIVDHNGYQSLGRTKVTHPSFYPIVDKFLTFGWSATVIDGHNSGMLSSWLYHHVVPFALIANTVKGKGVSFMENNPIWHYRSPNAEEYVKARRELR